MKPRLTCVYLYSDGHAIEVFEKQDKDAGTINFVHVHEKWTTAICGFTGRIVIGRYSGALAAICRRADVIRATEPTLDAGSEGTRAKGIAFGTLEVKGKDGSLYFHDMPGTISGPYHYQRDHIDRFNPDCRTWGNYPVAKVHRVKPAAAPLELATVGGAR